MPPSRERPRWSAAKWTAAILAVTVHVAFVLFLVFSVSWQSHKPEMVTAELYAPEKKEAPKPTPEPPKPQPEPAPPPPEPPKPPPEPPKPPPEPPKPPEPSQADIALKEKQERLKREEAERERLAAEKREAEKRETEKREAAKREAEKRAQEQKRLAEARERQARETQALQAQAERERERQQQLAAEQARARADADYIRRIQAKVRGNVTLPPDLNGNPEAIFDVVQLPTGEIIDVQLVKSSGVRAYDEAVQRAILKSSPLPRPDSPDMFRRRLTLKFRPLD
ncbi:MAG TPA: cell envelope integrity protein TolA [Casimicrobiaceae bacterium]|nr:cell envelope integrity protein TolA [Casimicrobiaceae bacterium]